MKRFTDAGRQAIASRNFYAALCLALTMPDICASLEDPGPGKSQQRYIRWCKQWVEPKFSSPFAPDYYLRGIFVTAEDCYQIRCSLIHSGKAEIDPARKRELDRFEFFDDTAGSHLNRFHANVVNGVKLVGFLQLKADLFSEALFAAAQEWDAHVANDAKVQVEKAKLLVIRSKGAFIQGIQFG